MPWLVGFCLPPLAFPLVLTSHRHSALIQPGGEEAGEELCVQTALPRAGFVSLLGKIHMLASINLGCWRQGGWPVLCIVGCLATPLTPT